MSKWYNSDVKLKEMIILASTTPPYSLRLPDVLMAKLRKLAENNKRSINKEIEFLVEQAIKEYEKEHGPLSASSD